MKSKVKMRNNRNIVNVFYTVKADKNFTPFELQDILEQFLDIIYEKEINKFVEIVSVSHDIKVFRSGEQKSIIEVGKNYSDIKTKFLLSIVIIYKINSPCRN